MNDSGFREIQLSGKQVVFLFMAGVVAAVAIFLLGVSVGRGVIQPGAAATANTAAVGTVADAGPPGALPPPQTPKPGELQYHETLKGSGDAKPVAPPPAATTTPKPTATPTASPSPTVPASKPTPTPATKPSAPSKPAAAAGEQWYVQVDSFASRDNASRRQAELKAKGFAASIYTAPGEGARYKVRIGPFDAAAADAMMARLRKEGYSPSRTR